MLSSSLDTSLKVSKTTSPEKLFGYDCVTLYKKTFCDKNTNILAFHTLGLKCCVHP